MEYHLNVADSIATGISKKFDALKPEVTKVDANFGEFSARFEALLSDFRGDYGYAYDEATIRRTNTFLDVLSRRAIVSYAPRPRFMPIAEHRKRTKTPPGFKDDGDGDFYVWLDTLMSILEAKDSGKIFNGLVLVSNDKKPDWSREGIAHPILSAECMALVQVPFQIWDLKRLVSEVTRAA